MTVQFWGVRGSVPVPGPDTLRVGGNTSCLSVEWEDRLLVIDAGTGIRGLGQSLRGSAKEVYLVLSHLHIDHIMGFPLFAPLHEPGPPLYLIDYRRDGQAWSLLDLLDGVFFPLSPSDLPSRCERVREEAVPFLQRRGMAVTTLDANHPGGAYGFRIADADRVVVHIPDNELNPPEAARRTSMAEFVRFCRDADVLSHDAQYLSSDLPEKHGWGHSQVKDVCDLAVAASVRRLVLFHHDPDRSDADLLAIESWARDYLGDTPVVCTVAREGLRYDL